MPLTYAGYLKVDQLLELQQPKSSPPEHDEMLFIVIHQTYELWFKLMLHELEKVCRDFSANDLFGAIQTWKRLRTIMKTLVGQLDILETMTPMSFTSFRDRLETSSGFQSAQFREFEFILGHKRPEMMKPCAVEPVGHAKVVSRLHTRSVVDHFYDFLEHRGIAIPAALRAKPVEESTRPDVDVQEGILRLYQSGDNSEVVILLELMTDFDEGQQEWRYRHVKAVERTIGNKQGTGGSLGVEFLKRSLFTPLFPDLWAIRHRL